MTLCYGSFADEPTREPILFTLSALIVNTDLFDDPRLAEHEVANVLISLARREEPRRRSASKPRADSYKTNMQHIPYRGSAPALNDLLAGNVDLVFDNMTTVPPQVREGRLRALGVASLKRTPLAPDIPAIAETHPGFEATSWVGVVGPAGVPAPILNKLAAAFHAAMSDPEVVTRLKALGATPETDTSRNSNNSSWLTGPSG